jgi:hypothetical protein
MLGRLAIVLALVLSCSVSPAAMATPDATAAPPADERDEQLFQHWVAEPPERAAAYDALWKDLQQQGLAQVLPPHQLLRSASSWRVCEGQPFALPPPSQWPKLAQVLRLFQALRAAAVLAEVEVHSGYRDEALNRCAGGAPGSAHWREFALDITPAGDAAVAAQRLCSFWREQGEAWQMGFGRYASGRLHIDTLRWRRWGVDC